MTPRPVEPLPADASLLRATSGDDATFEAAFDGAPIGIALVHPNGQIIRANGALGQLFGRTPGGLVGRTVHEFGHPDDASIRLADREELASGAVQRSSYVKRYLDGNGETVWLRVSTTRIGFPTGPVFLSHFVDITQQELATRRIEFAATHDPLTGLANRARLMTLLEAALPEAGPAGSEPVTVLFVDLDDFKIANDSLGHEAGDQLLRVVGRRLAHAVRFGETARFGGDEFVVLCTGLELDGVPALCSRLLQVLAEPVEVDGRPLRVTASIGIARAEPGSTPSSLLRDADAAMYAAKDAGRDRYMVSDEVVRGSATAALTEEGELRSALAAGRLTLHAQPIRDLTTMAITSVETLARWPHPVRGDLAPGAFVGLASRSGLSRQLGRWALGEALRRRAGWVARTRNPDLRVSVNLDAEHLVDASLVDDVSAALAATGLPGSALTIEITERTLVDAFPAILSRLSVLVADGVRLSLDDFGTGWSSLSYLRLLPVSELKVDRVFVGGAARCPREAVILAGMAGIGRGLGMSVVAEGIETAEDLAAARAAGCTSGQGYLLGRPSPDGADWVVDPGVLLATVPQVVER